MRQTIDGRGDAFCLGNLHYRSATQLAVVGQHSCRLTGREGAVLQSLLQRAGQVVSKAALGSLVTYGYGTLSPAAIEVYVHRLRRLLARLESDVEIRTVLGAGYVVSPRAAAALDPALAPSGLR